MSQMTVTMTVSLVLQWLQVVRGWFLDEWNRLDLLFPFTTQWSTVTFMTQRNFYTLVIQSNDPKWPTMAVIYRKMTVTTTPLQHKMTKMTITMTKSHHKMTKSKWPLNDTTWFWNDCHNDCRSVLQYSSDYHILMLVSTQCMEDPQWITSKSQSLVD